MVRYLFVLTLMLTLLGITTSEASAQYVQLTLTPTKARWGEPVLVYAANVSKTTFKINDGWPWTVLDSQNRVIWRTPYPGKEITMRPGFRQWWMWPQEDLNSQLVPPGRYQIQLPYKTLAGQPLVIGRWVEIMDAKVTMSGNATPGSRVTFALSAPPSAGAPYAFALALSGNYGIKMPGGLRFPLDPDGLFLLTATGAFLFSGNFTGKLDASGAATAWLDIPRWPGLRGIDLYGAYLTMKPTAPGGVFAVSHGVLIPIR